jgi:hypothetical protein
MRLCRPEAGGSGAAIMADPAMVVLGLLKSKLIPAVAHMRDTNTCHAAVIVDQCETDMNFARAVVAGWPRIVSNLCEHFRANIPQESDLRVALIAVGNGCTLENLGGPAKGLEVVMSEMPLEITKLVIRFARGKRCSEEARV